MRKIITIRVVAILLAAPWPPPPIRNGTIPVARYCVLSNRNGQPFVMTAMRRMVVELSIISHVNGWRDTYSPKRDKDSE